MSEQDLVRIEMEPELLTTVLSPYREGCRYLLRATVEHPPGGGEAFDEDDEPFLARIEGEFEIPRSFYIDETGHFNSIEFNLCYNQLIYSIMAQCCASRILPELDIPLDEYLRRQLPDVLIHDFHSKFRRPLDPRRFRGSLTVRSAHSSRRFVLLKTTTEYSDGKGGVAQGAVSIAFVNHPEQDSSRAKSTNPVRTGSDA